MNSEMPIGEAPKSTAELVVDPFAISAYIRWLNEELKRARKLYAISVKAHIASGELARLPLQKLP